jgi:hypothetical protein
MRNFTEVNEQFPDMFPEGPEEPLETCDFLSFLIKKLWLLHYNSPPPGEAAWAEMVESRTNPCWHVAW